MELKDMLSFLGIPSLLCSLLLTIFTWCRARFSKAEKENSALKDGMRALLRDRLLNSYKNYYTQGYCDIDDKENWENMYAQYKALGGNGVITKIHEKLLTLSEFKTEDN